MKLRTRNLILSALFTALTIVGAKINFMLPDIPVTLQPLIVILAGSLIGSKAAFLSQFVYLLIGIAGIPVFAKPVAGPAYLVQPTFGYLLGFVAASFIIGIIIENSHSKSFFTFLIASTSGLLVIYLFGILYFYGLMNIFLSSQIGLASAAAMMIPYALKDFILGIVVSSLSYQIYHKTNIHLRRYGREA